MDYEAPELSAEGYPPRTASSPPMGTWACHPMPWAVYWMVPMGLSVPPVAERMQTGFRSKTQGV